MYGRVITTLSGESRAERVIHSWWGIALHLDVTGRGELVTSSGGFISFLEIKLY